MKIQYVVLRNDTNFTKGATTAQAVHAVTLCYAEHYDTAYGEYIKEGSKMTTAVLQANEQELLALIAALEKNAIKHSVWIEHPENTVTAVALYPYEKAYVQQIKELKSLKLY